MNNLHLMVRNLSRILLYIAPKDIISVPILCSWRENVNGPYEELNCLADCPLYCISNPTLFCILMEFRGNLFRLKNHIPSSILAFVGSNKIMLSFSNFRFSLLSRMNVQFCCIKCVFISSPRFVRKERPAAMQEFRSVYMGWKMNRVSFFIKVTRNRVKCWFTAIYLPSPASAACLLTLLPSCLGKLPAFLWVDGERRHPPCFLVRRQDSQLTWLFPYFWDMSHHVSKAVSIRTHSQPLLAFPLGHIAGGRGSPDLSESIDPSRGYHCGEVLKIPGSLLHD